MCLTAISVRTDDSGASMPHRLGYNDPIEGD